MVKIAPSVLAADFTILKEEINAVKNAGVEWLHYDVMDGHFVPNISFGHSILENIKNATDIYLDVHLMISEPRKYVDNFIKAGANLIVFHIEAMNDETDTLELIAYIKKHGIDVGLSIKPDTKVSQITKYLSLLDVVLVMSVEPGFGGQSFNSIAIDKIKELKQLREIHQYSYVIEVDGGINTDTAKLCKEAGVDVLVAGSSIFNSDNYQEAVTSLR